MKGAFGADEGLVPITILHTSDLHARLLPDPQGAGGFARLAAAIAREKDKSPRSTLVLNAGDMVQGTPVSTLFKGQPIFEIADLLGLDAAALGNHDFDYGWSQIEGYSKKARFPLLCANVLGPGNLPLADGPHVILEINNLKIGLIGAMTEGLFSLVFNEQLRGCKMLPLVETVRRWARELEPKTDLLIVLAHISPSEEDAILLNIPEIDLIASGHSHTALMQPKNQDNRLVIRSGSYARELGRLDLQVNPAAKKIASWTWQILPLTPDLPEHGEVQRRIAHWEAQVAPLVDVELAHSDAALDKTAVKALIETILMDAYKTDFAFMNIGGVRDGMPSGRILARHVWNIMPFENRIVIGAFQGSQLPASVVGRRAIVPTQIYTVATTEYVVEKQEREMLAHGLAFPRKEGMLRELIIDWMKQKKRIVPAPDSSP